MGGNSSQQVSRSGGHYSELLGTHPVRCDLRAQHEVAHESDLAYRKLSAGEGHGLPKSTLEQTDMVIQLVFLYSRNLSQYWLRNG